MFTVIVLNHNAYFVFLTINNKYYTNIKQQTQNMLNKQKCNSTILFLTRALLFYQK